MKQRTKKRLKRELKIFFFGRIMPVIIALIALCLTMWFLGILPFEINNGWFMLIIAVQMISSFVLSSWGLLYRFCGVSSAEFWSG